MTNGIDLQYGSEPGYVKLSSSVIYYLISVFNLLRVAEGVTLPSQLCDLELRVSDLEMSR